jgi:hypothetical protein
MGRGGGADGSPAAASREASPDASPERKNRAPAPRAKASGSSRAAGRSESELLASLRDEVARLGETLEAGWTCVVKPRGGDMSKGCDPYYISPTGRRYRSRQEVRLAAGAGAGDRAGGRRPLWRVFFRACRPCE